MCKSNKEYGHAVVAVDDDPAKLNQTIHGVPVKGTLEDIPELCTRYGIHSIIILPGVVLIGMQLGKFQAYDVHGQTSHVFSILAKIKPRRVGRVIDNFALI